MGHANEPANSVLETWTHAGLSLPIWSADETDYFRVADNPGSLRRRL
jgi:hypothetical protein